MVLSLAVAGALVMYACLGIILAIPSIPDVLSGKVADPISSTLETAVGSGGVWYLNWGIILSGVLGVIGLVMCTRIFSSPEHRAGVANAPVPDVERTDYNIGT